MGRNLIFQPTGSSSFGQQEIRLLADNGTGGTNIEIFRWLTVAVNVGTSMTLTQSAANGDSVTINIAGVYSIYMQGRVTNTGNFFGALLNAVAFTSSTNASTISYWEQPNTTSAQSTCVTLYLNVNDVIRWYNVGGNTGLANCQARIVRVA